MKSTALMGMWSEKTLQKFKQRVFLITLLSLKNLDAFVLLQFVLATDL